MSQLQQGFRVDEGLNQELRRSNGVSSYIDDLAVMLMRTQIDAWYDEFFEDEWSEVEL